MIQRVQTLYLFAASLVVSLMLFFPMTSFTFTSDDGTSGEIELTSFGLYSDGALREVLTSTTYMGVLNILVALLPFLIIFLYKSRLLQIRLCYVSWVLMLGLQLFVGYYLYVVNDVISIMDASNISYSPTIVLPLIGCILIWLGYRGIVKDEALVRSLDRLR